MEVGHQDALFHIAPISHALLVPQPWEMEGEPEGSQSYANWWRRGRIELPVQKKATLDILQA